MLPEAACRLPGLGQPRAALLCCAQSPYWLGVLSQLILCKVNVESHQSSVSSTLNVSSP